MSASQVYVGTPCGMILCIDRIDHNYKVTGRIYHGYRSEAMGFSSMAEAILSMDQFYDEMKYPFPGTKTRCFGKEREPVVIPYKRTEPLKKERTVSDKELLNHKGKRGTFIVRVEQRQHSSWQGRVTWMEKGETVAFRSALELLKLIDQALKQDMSNKNLDKGLEKTSKEEITQIKEEMEAV